MELAQLDAVVRKLDAVAPLRELEDLLKLMTVCHEKVQKKPFVYFTVDNCGLRTFLF